MFIDQDIIYPIALLIVLYIGWLMGRGRGGVIMLVLLILMVIASAPPISLPQRVDTLETQVKELRQIVGLEEVGKVIFYTMTLLNYLSAFLSLTQPQ